MTADQRLPEPPGHFQLAPVVDGAAAWALATELVLSPLRLTADVVASPDAGLVLVTD